MLPTCEKYGMGVIRVEPLLAGGWLSGRYSNDGESADSSRTLRGLVVL